MNITQFTNSFDACVGHAALQGAGSENVNGKTVNYFATPEGYYVLRYDGQARDWANEKKYSTLDEAKRAAKKVVH